MDPRPVRAELDRILRSPGFTHSERMARFLRCVVERALAGRGEELKEYLIGVEVFDRKTDYDPRVDPIVRVEARRLRSKLEEFYAANARGFAGLHRTAEGSLRPLLPYAGRHTACRNCSPRTNSQRGGIAHPKQ